VVVLDVAAVGFEVSVTLARRALVRVLEEIELELRGGAWVETKFDGPLDLLAQDLPR